MQLLKKGVTLHYKGGINIDTTGDESKALFFAITDFTVTVDTVVKKGKAVFVTVTENYNAGSVLNSYLDLITVFGQSINSVLPHFSLVFYANKIYGINGEDFIAGDYDVEDSIKNKTEHDSIELIYKKGELAFINKYLGHDRLLEKILKDTSETEEDYLSNITPLINLDSSMACPDTYYTDGFYCPEGVRNIDSKSGDTTQSFRFNFRGATSRYYFSYKHFISKVESEQHGQNRPNCNYSLVLYKIEE